MMKHRKQMINVLGQKQLVDVPVDDELYKADNHEEYQRVRSKLKHVSLDDIVLADESADIVAAYEKAQLYECLYNAIKTLNDKERRLVEYIFYDGLTHRKVAAMLGISSTAVGKQKWRIIAKLRKSLNDWI